MNDLVGVVLCCENARLQYVLHYVVFQYWSIPGQQGIRSSLQRHKQGDTIVIEQIPGEC